MLLSQQVKMVKLYLIKASLPASINTLSPENLGLTMTKLQSSAQQTLANNANQGRCFYKHTMEWQMNPHNSWISLVISLVA